MNTCTTCACWQGAALALLDERADELLRVLSDDATDDEVFTLLDSDERTDDRAKLEDDTRREDTDEERGSRLLGALELLTLEFIALALPGNALDGGARLLTEDLILSDDRA